MVHIDFYYDIVCPYAYIASTQIAGIENDTKATVSWKPVSLSGLYEFSKAPQGKSKSATTVMPPKKRAYFGRETVMQVDRYNVKLNAPPQYPISTLHCMRFLTWVSQQNTKDESLLVELSHGLFDSFWVKNDRLDDLTVFCNVILALLSRSKNGSILNVNNERDIRNIVEKDEKIKDSLYNNTKAASKTYSMFGVPTFVVDKNAKQMFWGVDRIGFLRNFCKEKGKLLYPPTDLVPSIRDKMLNDNNHFYKLRRERNQIEFFFDFASPWSFLGFCRLKEFEAYASKIVLRPLLLGAVFKAVGSPSVPMATVGPVKRKYMGMDFDRWYEAAGVRVKMNTNFPLRTVLALRVFIVDNSTIDCIFKAAWQENANISDAKALCKVLDRNGFNGKKLIEATKNVDVKKALQQSTSFAISKGLFGVPAYVVNEDYQRFVWGQDKMDLVKEMCHGWIAPTKNSIFEKEKQEKSKL